MTKFSVYFVIAFGIFMALKRIWNFNYLSEVKVVSESLQVVRTDWQEIGENERENASGKYKMMCPLFGRHWFTSSGSKR